MPVLPQKLLFFFSPISPPPVFQGSHLRTPCNKACPLSTKHLPLTTPRNTLRRIPTPAAVATVSAPKRVGRGYYIPSPSFVFFFECTQNGSKSLGQVITLCALIHG